MARRTREIKRTRKMRLWVKLLILLLIVTIGTIIYARFIGTSGIIAKEYLVSNDELPNSFNGLKIAHLSDIHYGQTTKKKQLKEIVENVNEYEPDIIVITGDLLDRDITYTEQEIKDLEACLQDLQANIGKYIIMGNHDNTQQIYKEVILNSGWTNLNETYEILYYKGNTPIIIAGMSTGEYSGLKPKEKVQQAIQIIKEQNIPYSILIMHEPDYINDFEFENFDLILAGHSHNGQVRLPFIGAIILPPHAKEYYNEYYQINDTDLYISSGIGTSNLKFRLFNRPSFNLYRIVTK